MMNRYIQQSGRFNPDNAEQSWTLPATWYWQNEIYVLEQEKIFARNWWYQCHENDLPNAGDYYCGRAGDQEIFVIRDQNKNLQAFYNVCSHRAHPLLQGQGNAKLIVCMVL